MTAKVANRLTYPVEWRYNQDTPTQDDIIGGRQPDTHLFEAASRHIRIAP